MPGMKRDRCFSITLLMIIMLPALLLFFVWSGCMQSMQTQQPLATQAKLAAESQIPAQPSRPTYYGPKKRIAVLDFEVQAREAPTEVGHGLSEMFITALTETGRFIVLERAAREAIFNELAFNASGAVKPGTEAEVGEMLGAQTLVKGVITEFQEEETKVGGGGLTAKIPGVGNLGIGMVSSENRYQHTHSLQWYDLSRHLGI